MPATFVDVSRQVANPEVEPCSPSPLDPFLAPVTPIACARKNALPNGALAMKRRWNTLLGALLIAAVATFPPPGLADLAASTPTRSPVVDSEGKARYLFILDEGLARRESDAGEPEARGPNDPANATDLYGWHRPKVRALVKRLERQYQVNAIRMTSWAMPTFSAHVSESTLETMRTDPNISDIVPIFDGDIVPSAWSDRVEGAEFVPWGKIALGMDDLVGTDTPVYLIDGRARSSVEVDENGPAANLEYSSAQQWSQTQDNGPGYAAHATFVAGVLGAKINGLGVRGLNNGAKVISVNIGVNEWVDPSSRPDDAMNALDWVLYDAETRGIYAVANISSNDATRDMQWFSTGWVARYIRRASNRVLVVNSAGNHHDRACFYAYAGTNAVDGILVAGGIDKEGREALGFSNPGFGPWAPGSNYGECVEVWAPAKDIISTYYNPQDPFFGRYGVRSMSGTSFAAPHVAAFAARYGSTSTTPVEREFHVRARLFATNYNDSGGFPIRVPSYAQPPNFIVPGRLLPVGVQDDTGTCQQTGCAYVSDSRYLSNVWNVGHGPPAWIEFDLGESKTLKAIRLVPEQLPEGNAVHRIYAGNTPSPTTLIETISGYGSILEPFAKELNAIARYVRVLTEASPSWVAWREVEMYGY